MSERMYKLIFLSAAAAVSCAVLQADDLDAALEAQKRTAQRRVYSERAVLEDQNLALPRPVTREERDLDRQLRERDAREDARPSLAPRPFTPSPSAEPRPQQDRNWLTPALLDEAASVSVSEEESDWVLRELDRQRELRTRDADVLRNEAATRSLQSGSQRPASILPEMDRLKEYQLAPQSLLRGAGGDGFSGQTVPPQSRQAEAITIRPARRDMGAPSSQPYSSGLPGSAPASAGTSLRTPGLSPYAVSGPGAGSAPSSSGLSSDWHTQEPAPLTPAQMIRRSAPIHRQDPFRDDLSPRVKSSIWE